MTDKDHLDHLAATRDFLRDLIGQATTAMYAINQHLIDTELAANDSRPKPYNLDPVIDGPDLGGVA